MSLASIVPVDHFLIMTIYALLVSAFFGLLWRNDPRSRARLFVKMDPRVKVEQAELQQQCG